MEFWNKIKFNINQIIATTEKHFKIRARFRLSFIMSYVQALLLLFLPLIIMDTLFSFNSQFGPWTRENYIIYLFVGYTIFLFQGIISYMPGEFRTEKYWNTLAAVMIAPYNKFNLLLGIMIAHFGYIFVPFVIFLILCLFFFSISFITLVFFLLLAVGVLLIFSAIALILGVFAISNENVRKILAVGFNLVIIISCIAYPYEIFPAFLQRIIDLNPIYYIIDILRLTWIEDNIILTITSHPIHFLIFLCLIIALPIIGILMFNYIFKKIGIVGY